MKRRLYIIVGMLLVMVLLLGLSNTVALADEDPPGCSLSGCHGGGDETGGGGDDSDGGDGGDGGSGDNGGSNNDGNQDDSDVNDDNTPPPVSCSPGTTSESGFYLPFESYYGGNVGDLNATVDVEDGQAMCVTVSGTVDTCTGQILDVPDYGMAPDGSLLVTGCPTAPPVPPHPCDEFTVTGGGVTCTSDLVPGNSGGGSAWEVTARAGWPGSEIHTRPYPATLIDWDTVIRVAGLGSSSGSGHLGYAAWGGGNSDAPAKGDWKDIVLRLEIKPAASWAEVLLENIGLIRMPIGQINTFQWNLPSHPAAGGGPLSGQVGQLEELEPDVPLYTNWVRAPYMVYCTLEYDEWVSVCVGGPDDSGGTDCGPRDPLTGERAGHREEYWRHHSETVPIYPTSPNVSVPANRLVDLNGDGTPDAYWGNGGILVRRMDDAGKVDNPSWEHSYSWGEIFYWAAREGQGQIGWPGVSP